MFNLQDATADHHAVVAMSKPGSLFQVRHKYGHDGWKIQSDQKSHFNVEGGETKIYWLQDPSHAQHPVTMGWADNKYAQAFQTSAAYLPVAGGTLTGNLQFSGGARIDCNNGNTVLHDRGCRSFGPLPTNRSSLVFSGANRLFSSYGSDSGATDKRSEKAYITVVAKPCPTVSHSKGKELATKEYVDANAGGSSEGAIAKSGSNTNPTLAKGEPVSCTIDNTLRVGV